MSMVLVGAAMTAAGPALVSYGRRRGEHDEENSRYLSIGYSLAICGPFLLLAFLLTFPAALLVAFAVCGIFWLSDMISLWRRNVRLTKGAAAYVSDVFVLVCCICLVRFFVVDIFVVPSSSMRPTLSVGDVMLADKFSYGVRLPILNQTILPVGSPRPGDVMVFSWPVHPRETFVKRVIGVPGDEITLNGKTLLVNGSPVFHKPTGSVVYEGDDGGQISADSFYETLPWPFDIVIHSVLYRNDRPWLDVDSFNDFHPAKGCSLSGQTLHCIVPSDEYFVLGDNRDDSLDSRYWGFVPESDILGKVDLLLFNQHDWQRHFMKVK